MLKPVRLAFVVALVLGFLQLVASISSPLALLGTFICLAAAVGLWRGSVWCGFGPALWFAVQVGTVLIVALVSRQTLAAEQLVTLIIAATIYSPAVWIFYRAGKTLSAAGSPPSFAMPWIALTILTVALGMTLVLFRPYVIPTGTMEETILIGDHLFVPRFGVPVPARGDVIAFLYPVDPSQTFLKRVIGVSGDRVRISNKEVYLNGKKLREPYAYHKASYIDSYRDNFPSDPNVSVDRRATEMLRDHLANGEVVVPPNSYFVLGDNRDLSLDSRYWGFVPGENIIGEPWIVYWSTDTTTTLSGKQPSEWALLGRTRWNRIFTVIHSYPI